MNHVEPSWAERARTVVANARWASLHTGCRRLPPTLTVVDVECGDDGRPRIWLEGSAPAVAGLSSCQVASLTMSCPDSVWVLRLVGSFKAEPSDRSGFRAYKPTLLSARVIGPRQVTIPLAEFLHVDPDPLGGHAAVMVEHLRYAHAEDLLACVRAHGHVAEAVLPTGLDRYGIELAVLGEHGVNRIRLDFPNGPIRHLDQLNAGLHLPLVCHCQP